MTVARLARPVIASLLAGSLLVACGSSSGSSATTAPKASATAAATTAKAAGGTAATPTTAKGAGGAATTAAKATAGKADCNAVKAAVGGLIVNWQLVAQFPKETDVTKWPERVASIGTLGQFASQLDVLQTQLGANADAAKAIAFMKGANAIVQKGLGGDAGAPKALADYLGSDLAAVLAKQAAIGIAASAAGC